MFGTIMILIGFFGGFITPVLAFVIFKYWQWVNYKKTLSRLNIALEEMYDVLKGMNKDLDEALEKSLEDLKGITFDRRN